jgi:hypothetical protein
MKYWIIITKKWSLLNFFSKGDNGSIRSWADLDGDVVHEASWGWRMSDWGGLSNEIHASEGAYSCNGVILDRSLRKLLESWFVDHDKCSWKVELVGVVQGDNWGIWSSNLCRVVQLKSHYILFIIWEDIFIWFKRLPLFFSIFNKSSILRELRSKGYIFGVIIVSITLWLIETSIFQVKTNA